MFKLIGAAIVMLAVGLIGMGKYNELSERRKTLSEIEDGAQKIKNNLRLLCMPLHECFRSGGTFFEKAAQYISEGASPKEAIERVAQKERELQKEDREVLFRFAQGLCADDCQGQLLNVESLILQIGRKSARAEKELKTKGNLFIKGSLLLGGAVVLILM